MDPVVHIQRQMAELLLKLNGKSLPSLLVKRPRPYHGMLLEWAENGVQLWVKRAAQDLGDKFYLEPNGPAACKLLDLAAKSWPSKIVKGKK